MAQRTTKPTRALARFGVYRTASEAEFGILAIADEYRLALCNLLQVQHMAELDVRDDYFPALFAAMCAKEYAELPVWELERQIKQHHSDVRDRNAVTPEQYAALEAAEEVLKAAKRAVTAARQPWQLSQWAFAAWLQRQADWKNVKQLARRRELYAALQLPTDPAVYAQILTENAVAAAAATALRTGDPPRPVTPTSPSAIHVPGVLAYGRVWLDYDLQVRELGQRYKPRLHPAIRAEIWEASQPKTSPTGPGMRYQAGRPVEPRRWTKLTVQCGRGGLRVQAALRGTPQLTLTPRYTNHKQQRDDTVYDVRQAIGTEDNPQYVTYCVKFHRRLPDEAVIQRWSLCVQPDGTRTCIPTVANMDFAKPQGQGTLAFDLSWRRCQDGIQVCHLYGDHANERVIVPDWLIDRRMAVSAAQQIADTQSNTLLTERGCTPGVDEKQGFAALLVYAEAHPEDAAATNLAANCQVQLDRALRIAQQAARCIEEIYRVAASRVCRLHDRLVLTQLNLQQLKLYDRRKLLRQDALPQAVRERLHVVAPGKLKACLEGYGLERLAFTRRPQESLQQRREREARYAAAVASGEVPSPPAADARETDLVGSYVRNLGIKTGPRVLPERRCSRMGA